MAATPSKLCFVVAQAATGGNRMSKDRTLTLQELQQRLGAFPPPVLVDVRRAPEALVGWAHEFEPSANSCPVPYPEVRAVATKAPGLLAVSLGLSAMFADDQAMPKWGMMVYDSLYAWSREVQDEAHGWYPEKLRVPTPA
jgi:hypothetical protein